MAQATVKAVYVNQPGKNPKYGSIKGDDGHYYSIPVDRLGDFKQGESYSFEYSTQNVKGRDYYTFTRFTDASAKPAANGNGAYRDASPETAERIFVCGVVNGWAHSGLVKVDGQSLENAVLIARQAWLNTLGADAP